MGLQSNQLPRLGLCLIFLLICLPAQAQEAPLTRLFSTGSTSSFRVRLTVRSEIEGQRTEKIGNVIYAVPFTRSAECRIAWRATTQIMQVSPDGSAGVQESLDGFQISAATLPDSASASAGQDKAAAELSAALEETLARWGTPRALRYRESFSGQLSELSAEGGPQLGEQGFPLLTLWLLRALRPASALPARPLRIGDRWEEPREVLSKDWKQVSATESGEWLEAPRNPEAAARLHLVQQISGQAPAPGNEGTLELRFHAEALNTVSLQDGSLIGATRSASRDLVRVLGPVAGLPDPPRLRATISAQVEIELCVDVSC
jgi:hypothetical protein